MCAGDEQLECVPATEERPRCKAGRDVCSEDDSGGAGASLLPGLKSSEHGQHQQQQANAAPTRLLLPSPSTLRRRALFQSHSHGNTEEEGSCLHVRRAQDQVAGAAGWEAGGEQQQQQKQQQEQQAGCKARGSAVLLHHLALQGRSPIVKPSRPAREGRARQQVDYVDYFKLHQQVRRAAAVQLPRACHAYAEDVHSRAGRHGHGRELTYATHSVTGMHSVMGMRCCVRTEAPRMGWMMVTGLMSHRTSQEAHMVLWDRAPRPSASAR